LLSREARSLIAALDHLDHQLSLMTERATKVAAQVGAEQINRTPGPLSAQLRCGPDFYQISHYEAAGSW
jgi:hypothetical protein